LLETLVVLRRREVLIKILAAVTGKGGWAGDREHLYAPASLPEPEHLPSTALANPSGLVDGSKEMSVAGGGGEGV
jgi:hypothetical protein